MTLKSSSDRYGAVAVTIHWLSALFIIALIGSGLRAEGLEDAAGKAGILRVHAVLGIAVLLLTLARIAWWWLADTKPAPAPMPSWQNRAARTAHVLLYVVILGMTASGLGMVLLSGAWPILFGGAGGTLPDFHDYPPRGPHGLGAKVMIALFVLHAGAALHHHFIKRDGLLRRMWYGPRGV